MIITQRESQKSSFCMGNLSRLGGCSTGRPSVAARCIAGHLLGQQLLFTMRKGATGATSAIANLEEFAQRRFVHSSLDFWRRFGIGKLKTVNTVILFAKVRNPSQHVGAFKVFKRCCETLEN